jgi:hypothetical protein
VAGPAVVGRGARVGRNALVAQCVVVPGTKVKEAENHRHRVLAEGRGATSRAAASVLDPFAAPLGGQSPSRPQRRPPDVVYPTFKTWVEPLLALAVLVLLSPSFSSSP